MHFSILLVINTTNSRHCVARSSPPWPCSMNCIHRRRISSPTIVTRVVNNVRSATIVLYARILICAKNATRPNRNMNTRWNDLFRRSLMLVKTASIIPWIVMANPWPALNYNDNNRCNGASKHCCMLWTVEMPIASIEVVSVINVSFNIRKNAKAKIVNVMFANKWSFSAGITRRPAWNRTVKSHSVRIWNRKYRNNGPLVCKPIDVVCKQWCNRERTLCKHHRSSSTIINSHNHSISNSIRPNRSKVIWRRNPLCSLNHWFCSLVSINTALSSASTYDSSGKPAPVTLIRAPQQHTAAAAAATAASLVQSNLYNSSTETESWQTNAAAAAAAANTESIESIDWTCETRFIDGRSSPAAAATSAHRAHWIETVDLSTVDQQNSCSSSTIHRPCHTYSHIYSTADTSANLAHVIVTASIESSAKLQYSDAPSTSCYHPTARTESISLTHTFSSPQIELCDTSPQLHSPNKFHAQSDATTIECHFDSTLSILISTTTAAAATATATTTTTTGATRSICALTISLLGYTLYRFSSSLVCFAFRPHLCLSVSLSLSVSFLRLSLIHITHLRSRTHSFLFVSVYLFRLLFSSNVKENKNLVILEHIQEQFYFLLLG